MRREKFKNVNDIFDNFITIELVNPMNQKDINKISLKKNKTEHNTLKT
jgi:hypothetical protein